MKPNQTTDKYTPSPLTGIIIGILILGLVKRRVYGSGVYIIKKTYVGLLNYAYIGLLGAFEAVQGRMA